jgi:uncharacterized damage-inducible protein DinB
MMNAAAQAAVADRAPAAHAVWALRERLQELMRLVLTLPAEAYCARPSHRSGSIGEHVRHMLDHVSSLIAAHPAAVLSYDHRSRGTAVETDPGMAVREMMRLDAALDRWNERTLDEPVAVSAMTSTDGGSVTGWSTLARELAFVMGHTVHHQAIIALLLERLDAEMPDERFGYAPSTPRRA